MAQFQTSWVCYQVYSISLLFESTISYACDCKIHSENVDVELLELALFENSLSGVLPNGLGENSLLEGIDFYNNFITGVIPSSFANLGGSLHLIFFSDY